MIPKHAATIATGAELAAFAARMARAPWIAVDTEFKRENTYYPELCLVQIADSDEIGLIDVLAIDDLAPLAMLMDRAGPLKVLHAAEQDLEVLYQALDILPAPLFDTQLAAVLVGFDDQMGYARLIEALLDVRLPKSHTRTDWTQRPLSEQALAYAADDVRYLAVAYPLLRARLEDLGRLDWPEADFAALADPRRFQPAPEDAWRRLRGWQRLKPAQQQALAGLAAWREREAMRANRPRKWILKDDALVEIARRRPEDDAALTRIRSLPAKIARRHGPALLEAVATARRRPSEPLGIMPGPLSDDQTQRLEDAMQALRLCAAQTGIAATALASRRELQRLVTGERDLRILSGWRAAAAGNAILDVVEGRRRIVGSGDTARFVG